MLAGAHGAESGRADNMVILDAQGVKNLRLKLTGAEESDFEQSIFALGRIEVLPGNRAIVSSRIPGRATSVLVKPDQEIKEGQEVIWVESRQPGDPPPTMKLTAPKSGFVSVVNVAIGQPISPDDSLLEVIDLSEVHAIAKVPEHFAGRLKVGQKAHIRVSGFPDKTFEAELAHIGTLAEADTGTLETAFHVANPGLLLRPGMKAEFSIVTASRSGVMSIPREAVQGEGASRFVYVADYELKNAFLKTPVVIGEQNDTMVEITNGLLPGDEVVTQGAYSLAFAGKGSVSLKEALDAAHGHPHGEDGSELSAEDQSKAGGGSSGFGKGGSGFNLLTVFFAGLSAVLFVLMLVSHNARKRAIA